NYSLQNAASTLEDSNYLNVMVNKLHNKPEQLGKLVIFINELKSMYSNYYELFELDNEQLLEFQKLLKKMIKNIPYTT
ncbi:MAG: hypothetical protein H0X03_06445, partial [Nitrosopumilus sp.]|nr:hypothetical protein [Nitrosopumilus sp.]